MLYPPLLIRVRNVWSFADNLIVNITTHFSQESYEFYELVLVFYEFLDWCFLSLLLWHFIVCKFFLKEFVKIRFCSLDKVFDKIQQEVETIDIDLFQVDSELIDAWVFEFFLDEGHFLTTFACDIAEAMQNGVSIGRLDFKINLIRNENFYSNKIVVFDGHFERGFFLFVLRQWIKSLSQQESD